MSEENLLKDVSDNGDIGGTSDIRTSINSNTTESSSHYYTNRESHINETKNNKTSKNLNKANQEEYQQTLLEMSEKILIK